MPKKKTEPGAMDDDAKKRAESNKKKKAGMLQSIFDDNTTGRYSDPKDD